MLLTDTPDRFPALRAWQIACAMVVLGLGVAIAWLAVLV
jgi:hypothetical protein